MVNNVVQIAAGHDHSMILKLDGSVWVAGRNNYGQIGDGTTRSSNTFIEVITGGVHAIAAGDWHSIVLKQDGSMWGTGRNNFGQLGVGVTRTINTAYMRVLPIRDGACHMVPWGVPR